MTYLIVGECLALLMLSKAKWTLDALGSRPSRVAYLGFVMIAVAWPMTLALILQAFFRGEDS